MAYISSHLNFVKKAARNSPLTFSMEHLLHRLYGVDALSECPHVKNYKMTA